jgi:hypothetical protein
MNTTANAIWTAHIKADLHTIVFAKVDKVLQDLIASVSFALQASYHDEGYSYAACFGQDMFFPTTYIAN